VYFALWPDDAVRQQIASITREEVDRSGGVAIRPGKFHATLAFLGSIAEEELPRLADIAASLRAAPFEFVFDRIETWTAAKVLCLVSAQPAPALLDLAARLRFSLLEHRVEFSREAFRAHVTLARRPSLRPGQRIDAPIGPVIWPVREFVLVESKPVAQASEYGILQRWTLCE